MAKRSRSKKPLDGESSYPLAALPNKHAFFGGPYGSVNVADGFSELFPTYGQENLSYSESFPSSHRTGKQPGNLRPLKVIHVGHSMVRAGIEVWLKALIRGCNPERIHFERCVVTSPLSDPRV